ncbi:MAG: 4-(cytidine 5'-diphospho)-2-C-methyl-D-erythritol kinase [Hydrogenimonas sp.]|nr:4-(cytidine 5'-diphospho)-2-C-methyl-D-erythritol kinase [Hydrogenimonas sp.]
MTRLAPAKVNIFLKITGIRGAYHELRSRFVRVDSLCDTLKFIKKERKSDRFELLCSTPLPERNSVSESYRLLKELKPQVELFFKEYAVLLKKSIPMGAGLGGGSSDAAAFLNLCNDVCDLGLSKDELARIGESVGADVPFFVYGYASANVEGVGEKIEPFDDEPLDLKLFTPPIHCDTGAVYRCFRDRFGDKIAKDSAREWLDVSSTKLMQSLKPLEANDLYAPSLLLYPELEEHSSNSRFFSGSGSTFFEKR